MHTTLDVIVIYSYQDKLEIKKFFKCFMFKEFITSLFYIYIKKNYIIKVELIPVNALTSIV